MAFADLTFAAPEWVWPGILVLATGLALSIRSYRSVGRSGLAGLCVGAKSLGLAAVALCLLEPRWTTQRAKPGANLLAVVADNSRSLQIKDPGESKSRGDKLRSLLSPDGGSWQAGLEENFQVRRFTFDHRLTAVHDFAGLDFSGNATALGTALNGLRERFSGRPAAGVILLTDGNATDLPALLDDLSGLPPIFPVVIGQSAAIRDVSVGQVTVTQTAFEDAPVTFQGDVVATGLEGEGIVVQLVDAAGHKLDEVTQRVRRSTETLPFRFRFRPEKPGLTFYQVRAALANEAGPERKVADSREATLVNNTRTVPVDRGREPFRVLYVAGRPNWEYKFLNRALQSDDQLQLVALMRVAQREPKFEFRGREGETGNPLFRGFGAQSREEVERYDQPVLVRLNTRDDQELRAGFPSTPEELFGYHAVILDDLEAGFFTPVQAALLHRFVAERGGSVLMLGGMESFREGHYQQTPIGELLPVYLDRRPDDVPPGPVRFQLAREGWLQAWARMRDNEIDENVRLHSMPAFQVLNPVREIKPAATIVATAANEQGHEFPALVTQRFGRGRTAALLIGDFWRWGMQNADARSDMEKAWRQMTRWLVADVPRSVELTAEAGPEGYSRAVRLQVRVRDSALRPLDDASVAVTVEPPPAAGTNVAPRSLRLIAEASLDEPGLYEAIWNPTETGGYRATTAVTNSAGLAVGHAEAGWSSEPDADEFRSLQPNVALLEQLARRTGGEIVPTASLAAFVRHLPQRNAPVMEMAVTPLWHTPILLAFALACFCLEWGLRRWKGMP